MSSIILGQGMNVVIKGREWIEKNCPGNKHLFEYADRVVTIDEIYYPYGFGVFSTKQCNVFAFPEDAINTDVCVESIRLDSDVNDGDIIVVRYDLVPEEFIQGIRVTRQMASDAYAGRMFEVLGRYGPTCSIRDRRGRTSTWRWTTEMFLGKIVNNIRRDISDIQKIQL